MSMVPTLRRWAQPLTCATGILLVLLGILHLIATPVLIGWSSGQVHSENAALLIAAMRLNHILVGILLIPLGVSTYWAGRALNQSWALRLAGMNAVTLLCLPVLLVVIMPLESLDAVLFRLAIFVLLAACLVQILALVGVWRSRPRQS